MTSLASSIKPSIATFHSLKLNTVFLFDNLIDTLNLTLRLLKVGGEGRAELFTGGGAGEFAQGSGKLFSAL